MWCKVQSLAMQKNTKERISFCTTLYRMHVHIQLPYLIKCYVCRKIGISYNCRLHYCITVKLQEYQ